MPFESFGRIDLISGTNLRSSALAFLSKRLDDSPHLPPSLGSVDLASTHAHTDLLFATDQKKPFQQKVTHVEADEDATVRTVFLQRTVLQRDEI